MWTHYTHLSSPRGRIDETRSPNHSHACTANMHIGVRTHACALAFPLQAIQAKRSRLGRSAFRCMCVTKAGTKQHADALSGACPAHGRAPGRAPWGPRRAPRPCRRPTCPAAASADSAPSHPPIGSAHAAGCWYQGVARKRQVTVRVIVYGEMTLQRATACMRRCLTTLPGQACSQPPALYGVDGNPYVTSNQVALHSSLCSSTQRAQRHALSQGGSAPGRQPQWPL